ncbi:MAG: NAD(P)H-dependent oxidoreductase subunit E [Candidatus Bathyarchaeota archaeon]|nr:NAD(P)H-dependent oxidoreductase subunit E [Candidatus Termiticorpusculum sp.]
MTTEDIRRAQLERVLKKNNYQKSALLEILHSAQEIYGYLDQNLLVDIAGSLNLPPSHVYGVVTFYSYFKMRKPGQHIVTACLGTACYVKGVKQIIEAIEEEFNLKVGGSTADGKLSLSLTRCIGACAMAPAVVLDDQVIGKATKEIVIERIRNVLAGERDESV